MSKWNEDIIHHELNLNHFRVTIFGSARIQENDPIYQQIYNLAKEVGKHNIDIVTGGGPGLMDAANSGHQAGRTNNDSQSVGLNITLEHEQSANKHLDIKMQFEQFSERLDSFIKLSNIVVVAPGGVGTLLELFYTWQLIQVKKTERKEIIMLGTMWPELIEWIKTSPLKNQLMKEEDFTYIHLAKDNKEAMDIILDKYNSYKLISL